MMPNTTRTKSSISSLSLNGSPWLRSMEEEEQRLAKDASALSVGRKSSIYLNFAVTCLSFLRLKLQVSFLFAQAPLQPLNFAPS